MRDIVIGKEFTCKDNGTEFLQGRRVRYMGVIVMIVDVLQKFFVFSRRTLLKSHIIIPFV